MELNGLSILQGLLINIFWLLLAFIMGYVLGYVVSNVIRKLLTINKLEKGLVRYGAVTSELWASIVSFVAQSTKWWFVILIVVSAYQNAFQVDSVQDPIVMFFYFVNSLLLLALLTIGGLLLGGVLYKITKDFLISIGLESELGKHRVADSIGGIPISNILASIVKWYTVLVFIWQGLVIFNAPFSISPEFNKLGMVMEGVLVGYVPEAILGLLVLIVALIIADFAGSNIRKRNVSFGEILAMGAETMIVFFGAVLALPKFGIHNVSILEDSFKILMIGISVGLAIALGLGLKDVVAEAGKAYGKDIIKGRK